MPPSAQNGDSIRREFLKRLRETVRKCGSPAAVARAIGASASTMRRWLAGQGEPARSDLVRLAALAEVPVGWLAAGELVAVSEAGFLRTIHIREDGAVQLDLTGHEIGELRWHDETWLLIRPRRPKAVRR